MSHLSFLILAFSINFCPIKSDLSGNTAWPQASGFQKTRQNGTFLAFFNERLSTQNVIVARFARNVEKDFLCDFQTLWKRQFFVCFELPNYQNLLRFCMQKLCKFWFLMQQKKDVESLGASRLSYKLLRTVLPEGILLWTLVQWFVRVPCLQNLRPIGELVDKMRLEFWALAFFGAATAPPHIGSSKWDLLKRHLCYTTWF